MALTAAMDKYRVADLAVAPEHIRLAFLLESPYADEVVHAHPLAGGSGKSMARFLVERVPAFRQWRTDAPIGCQIVTRRESRLALMNCSNYPLDKSLYCPADYRENAATIDGWDLIRRNPAAVNRQDSRHREIEARIIDDLGDRLRRLPADALVVPCGDVARALAGKCGGGQTRFYPAKVPHPSRNRWSSPANFGDIKDFIATVARRMRGGA